MSVYLHKLYVLGCFVLMSNVFLFLFLEDKNWNVNLEYKEKLTPFSIKFTIIISKIVWQSHLLAEKTLYITYFTILQMKLMTYLYT